MALKYHLNNAFQAEIKYGKYDNRCRFCGRVYKNNDSVKWWLCPYRKYICCEECKNDGKDSDLCSECHHPLINHGVKDETDEE